MPETSQILMAWTTGLFAGFVVSFIPGPINVTIINEGARRGFRWALLIGLGSAAMEVVYCGVAFTGFAPVFASRTVRAFVELASFVAMLTLGWRLLRAKSLPAQSARAERIEERLHPHSAFATGFVRCLANPGVLLLWVTLAATFLTHEWVGAALAERAVCVAGVGAGSLLWFALLSYAVSLGHRKIAPETLLRMEHVSGVCLLIFAAVMATRLVLLLRAR